MSKVTKLTHERLTELLGFDPVAGVFVWKIATSNRVHVGGRAGVIHRPSGGRYIAVDGEKWMAHRLAWFYVKGEPPAHDIVPADGNYDNCSIGNLSEVSRVKLQHGRGVIATNTTGHAGVSKAKAGKFQSKITWNYHQIALGANFDTAEEAGEAYKVAEQALKTATCDDDVRSAVAAFRLAKRQRAAWANLQRLGAGLGWKSFEEFSADVTEIPNLRYSICPIDAARPTGPQNWKWALPVDADNSVRRDGAVAYQRAKREANRDHHRSREFIRLYGIDFGVYQQMLLDQKGVCAICEKPETKIENGTIRLLSVDHDHTTGAVRGLLCANCNMAIGYACDDVSVLEKAIVYLQKHGAPSNVVKFEPAVVNGALGNGT